MKQLELFFDSEDYLDMEDGRPVRGRKRKYCPDSAKMKKEQRLKRKLKSAGQLDLWPRNGV